MHTRKNMAVVAAIGVNEDGYREVVGCTEDFTESKECWRGFLSRLKSRGQRDVCMLTGDKAYRKAEISRTAARSNLAKNDLFVPNAPPSPVHARDISTRDSATAAPATGTDQT